MSEDVKVVYVHLLPVVDVETGEVVEIDRNEICKTSSDKRGILLRSIKTGKQYRFVRTQDELEEAWFPYGFRSFDSTNVVCMEHAKVYDEFRGRIYFEDNPTDKSFYGSVANVHKDHLKELIPEYGIKPIEEVTKAASKQQLPLFTKKSLPGMA